jgi:hypothetical protein
MRRSEQRLSDTTWHWGAIVVTVLVSCGVVLRSARAQEEMSAGEVSRLRRMRPVLLLALLFALTNPAAAGTLTAVAQTRRIEVSVVEMTRIWESGIPGVDPPTSTSVENFGDSTTAPDFTTFSATASVPEFPNSSATQQSEVGASSIAASGSHTAVAAIESNFTPPPPFSQIEETHDTESSFLVTFELISACDYTLTGSVSTSGGINALSQSRIRLTESDSAVIAEIEVTSDPDCADPSCVDVGPVALHEIGTLAPGIYTLEAESSGIATGFYSMATGDVTVSDGGQFNLQFLLTSPVPALPRWAGVALAALLALASAATLRRLSG